MSRAKALKEEQAGGCPSYKPCPICYSCENKAVHLYEACQTCQVPIDSHTHVAKSYMIQRKNFEVTVTEETRLQFVQLSGHD